VESQPKISIITACYNSSATIAQAISSLKKQTWPMVEHVVIDGASDDNTQSIVKSTLASSDVFVSEPDRGIYDALNKGIERSTGDVIGFLHSDDFFAKDDALAKIADVFSNGFDAVYGDMKIVDAKNLSRTVRNWVSGEFNRDKLKLGWMPPHPTFFMKREFYEKLGGFDTNYCIAGDYDSLVRYLSDPSIRVMYMPEVLVYMRGGGASNGSLRKMLTKSKEDFLVMRKNGINPFLALPYKNLSKLPQFISSKIHN